MRDRTWYSSSSISIVGSGTLGFFNQISDLNESNKAGVKLF
jgi:hypothetical protein